MAKGEIQILMMYLLYTKFKKSDYQFNAIWDMRMGGKKKQPENKNGFGADLHELPCSLWSNFVHESHAMTSQLLEELARRSPRVKLRG